MNSGDPLILTLHIDNASFEHYNDLRTTHFPPERNHLPAHITLFHQLPSWEIDQIERDLIEKSKQEPFKLSSNGLMPLGGGVAFKFHSVEARNLHCDLSNKWRDWLIPQDRKPFNPHITIQNKVSADVARALFDQLSNHTVSVEPMAIGLDLWYYRGGPWEFVKHYGFQC